MKVLVATAMYPSEARPAFGTFVRSQVESLRGIGIDAEPFVLDGRSRKLQYLTAITRLRRRLERGDVDVVHAHYSYVGAVARTQWRAPVVLTFHGDDLLGTIDQDGHTVPWSRLVARGGMALARVVDAVIVQNRVMAELLSGVAHVHVLSHEVDFDRFRVVAPAEARSSLGLDPSRKYVLFAASPDIAVKNFPLARDAVAAAQVADPSIELLVVDRAPQEQLALYFNAVDALVFTSFQEGSPNVIKQAMACGLPIVSTDVGDVTEVIGDTNGCEIVSRDVAAVAGALRRVLAWGGRTDGRSRVEHLRGDRVATRLASIYEDVASRRKHARAAA